MSRTTPTGPSYRLDTRELLTRAYAVALAVAAASLGGGLIAYGASLGAPVWELAIVSALALLAEKQPVRIHTNTEITVTVVPMLFAAVVFGPLAAMIVGAISLLGDFRAPHARWLTWTALRMLAGGLAGLAAGEVSGGGTSASRTLVLAVLAAALVDVITDVTLSSLVVLIRGGEVRGYLRSVRLVLLGTVPLYTPVIVLLAYVYDRLSGLTALLIFGPAFAAHRFYRAYQEQRLATTELEEANKRLEQANLSFATALVATLDARDRYTAGHSAAVAIYARDIAARMGLPVSEQQLAHLCGLVHDIGKIGLPAGLLEKPGPLTLDERRQMEQHSVIGERIVANVEGYGEIASVVRHHHERVDGRGYPDGLVGNEIPLISRIIAVADAYDAMISDRPYRDAMPSRVARLRLAQAVDTQFDTSVVAAFEAILASATDAYRNGRRSEFALLREWPADQREAAAS